MNVALISVLHTHLRKLATNNRHRQERVFANIISGLWQLHTEAGSEENRTSGSSLPGGGPYWSSAGKRQQTTFVCLCWGLTSQSIIFQSCRDGATASWVINQYFRGVKCLAQGHNTAAVGFEPPTSRSGVRHSTTEPPREPPDLSLRSPTLYHWATALPWQITGTRGPNTYHD